MYNFTVFEYYPTIVDSESRDDRLKKYERVLTQRLGGESTIVNVTILPPKVVSNASGYSARRRANEANEATCEEEYTPVEIKVTMQTAQTTEWVEEVVEECGKTTLDVNKENVTQCSDVKSTVDAELTLTEQPPPPPPSPPSPPAQQQSLWWLPIPLAILGLMLFCCAIVCPFFYCGARGDGGEGEGGIGFGVGSTKVGARMKSSLAAMGLRRPGSAHLGLRLEHTDLRYGLVE
mgnify:CR=1 FL=1